MLVFPAEAVESAGSPEPAGWGQSVEVTCFPAANLVETGPAASCSVASVEVARSPVENSADYRGAANAAGAENYREVARSAAKPVRYPAVAVPVA